MTPSVSFPGTHALALEVEIVAVAIRVSTAFVLAQAWVLSALVSTVCAVATSCVNWAFANHRAFPLALADAPLIRIAALVLLVYLESALAFLAATLHLRMVLPVRRIVTVAQARAASTSIASVPALERAQAAALTSLNVRRVLRVVAGRLGSFALRSMISPSAKKPHIPALSIVVKGSVARPLSSKAA